MKPWRTIGLSVLLAVVALLSACGDDAPPAPEDGGTDAGRDAQAICASSADCDDLSYCNGVETCAPGNAGADARGCVAGTPPCAGGETCDEDTDACRACSIDDADGDGVSDCDGDCDDADATRFPGATELCDYGGHDEDCNPTTYGTKDDDGDGATDARCCNTAPGGGPTCGLDCDDTRAGTHEGVPEVCNGRDDDCNGLVDDGDVQVAGFSDADRDLYGAGAMVMACAGSGLSVNGNDCNDSPGAGGRASPAFGEVTDDSIDNDCDGLVDETGGPAATWYRDADGDGFGDASDTQTSSTVLLGYVLLQGDCDDANAARSPVAPELCNGIDDDCNGELDFVVAIGNWEDDDGDGFLDAACGAAANDCDDGDGTTHPAAVELCDGRDNDCDGMLDELCGVVLDGGVPADAGSGGCAGGVPCATGSACERGLTDCSSGSAVCVGAGPAAAGTTCRVSVDVCDLAEACDGASLLCPTDAFVGAGTSCRASVGGCDVAETCSGSSAACPSDGFRAAGAECRTAAGACDAAETCTGASVDCPADALRSSGTVCRVDVGDCDVAETCSGVLASCPIDAFEPSGTTCGTGSCDLLGGCVSGCTAGAPCGTGNACEDGVVSCSTGAPVCIATGPKGAGTICRAAVSGCDVDELCDGSARTCPADAFASAATPCRASVDVCDAAETCTGATPACPADGFVSASTTCRASVDVCDAAETCTGSAAACPADGKLGAGTTCRAVAGLCDAAELCDGVSNACPANGWALGGTTCRAATGECDVGEACTGNEATCPVDLHATSGTSCTGGSCSLAGACAVGCFAGAPCSTGNACENGLISCGTGSAVCAPTGPKSASTLCRGSAGACDVDEYCDGASLTCPVDVVVTGGTTCRTVADLCDAEETCTGSDAACPVNGFAVAGTACSGGTCSGDGSCVTPAYLKASNTGPNDRFGGSISLSGDGLRLAVGARFEASNATGINGDQSNNTATNAGAVYVFAWSGGAWVQEAYLKGANTEAGDYFGDSVSLSADGSRLAVGAFGEDSNGLGGANNGASNAGAAYVFLRTGTTWTQEAYLKASNPDVGDAFGQAVSISADGTRLGVSAHWEASSATGVNGNGADNSAPSAGAAYVFARTGTAWAQEAYVKASNTQGGDYFGEALSLSGDGMRLAVGSAYEDSNSTGVNGVQADESAVNAGALYLFVRSGTSWTQEAYVKASNTEAADQFGKTLALSGDGSRLVAGAFVESSNAIGVGGNQADNSLTQAGAAYVFSRTGATWTQQAYLKASNTNLGDGFGTSVAISGDGTRVLVGAPGESSSAVLIGGNEFDNTASLAGAAYLFTWSTGAWTQTSYIKATNTGSPDQFANCVAISASGARLASGAFREASNATGVNGNGADNSFSYAGAAYVY